MGWIITLKDKNDEVIETIEIRSLIRMGEIDDVIREKNINGTIETIIIKKIESKK